jgi:glucose/arabinose dehydrogenase
MGHLHSYRRLAYGTAAALGLFAAACWPGEVSEPPREQEVTLLVRANLASTSVTTLVVEVTAPDITTPLAFNIPITDGMASGPVTVTSGSDRAFTLRAYDAAGIQTHEGADTLDIHPGSNPPLTIVLAPTAGDVPIDVTLGSVTVELVPTSDTLVAGDTATFTARIFDAEGLPVQEPVTWATLDPDVVTVERSTDSTAIVTAVDDGQTLVVAAFGGVGAAAQILVATRPAKQLVADGLTSPTFVTSPPGDASRLFVTERAGKIQIIENGVLLATPFLDLTGPPSNVSTNGEQGLLSMAFHPDFASNGQFFVYFTNDPDLDPATTDGDTRVVRYTVSASDPNVADAASGDTILAVDQPRPDHNGGQLQFGPDGMLYISLGDGGGSANAHNAQDSTTLLGSLLRIDVDGGTPYAIPGDNPFAGHPSAREEIWAYGLRNPWRFSFDRMTGDMYLADVGQHSWEEVNFESAGSAGGANYGWDIMEGLSCYPPEVTDCDQTGLTLPIFVYAHEGTGCTGSINGGYVYRRTDIPALSGHYLYSDFCKGFVRSFRVVDGAVVDERDWSTELGGAAFSLVSFGEDAAGNVYIVSMGSGEIFHIVPGN